MSSNLNAAADPAFFKILTIKDFSTVLRIPPAFWAKHKSDMMGNAKLVVDCGRIWNVKMERIGSVFCFTRGWSKFAEDAALQFGEFLVFTLSGNSQFHVNVYKTNFCQREILPLPYNLPHLPLRLPPVPSAPAPAPAGRSSTKSKSKSKSKSKQGNLLYFEARIKKSTKYRLYVPAKFSKASGLGEEKHVKMEYVGKGKHCSSSVAVVAVENRAKPNGVELGIGWSRFRYENKLVFGQIYSFQFDPTRNLILVNQKESD